MKAIETYNQLARDIDKKDEKLSFYNFYTRLLSSLIWLILPVVIIISVPLLKNNVEISEWWTNTFGRAYANVLTVFAKYFPISLTEIFFISLAVILVISVILLIRLLIHKKWISAISKIISIALVITSLIATYDLSCEFSYKRKPLNLPYYTRYVDNSEFKDIYNYFGEDLNYCLKTVAISSDGVISRPMNMYGLSKAVNEAYHLLDHNDYFYQNSTIAKPMMTSFIYRELQITGMTFNPFKESNLNYLATTLELPITVAHEFAHVKGVMREDDANQLAFYICLNSDNPYLRLSAYGVYFYQLSLLTTDIYMSDEDRDAIIDVDLNYYKARNYAYKYWKDHDLMGKIGDWWNNLYIKSSGVDEGTKSYDGGTEVIPVPDPVDPEIVRLSASKYQQLFFERYYRMKGNN